MAGSQVPGSPLRENQTKEKSVENNSKNNSEEVRQLLKAVVPGLNESQQFSIPSSENNLNVGFVHFTNAVGQHFSHKSVKNSNIENSDNVDPRSEEVRQKLRRVVPGLTDFSFFDFPSKVQLDVGVVHVTLANSQQTSSSGVTSSTSVASNLQTGSIRKVVLESSSQQVESTTSSSNVQVRYF